MDPASFSKNWNIILASGSPRRKMLMEHAGFKFEVRIKENDESFPASLKAGEIPEFLSQKKSLHFKDDLKKNDLLITADTIVWLRDHVLNKPLDRDEAIAMLQELSGNVHEVYSAVTLTTIRMQETIVVKSKVYFRSLSNEDIRNYVDTCLPYDKAGSYGAQEFISSGMNVCSMEEKKFAKQINNEVLMQDCFPSGNREIKMSGVEKINGSYFNVMGFPIAEVWEKMKKIKNII